MQDIGIENFKISLVDDYPYRGKFEAKAMRDNYIHNNIGRCYNGIIEGKTKEEYKEDKRIYKKQYYKENKKYISRQQKDYGIDNREKIKERKAIKIHCECGSVIQKGSKSKHNKSKKHLEYIEKREDEFEGL